MNNNSNYPDGIFNNTINGDFSHVNSVLQSLSNTDLINQFQKFAQFKNIYNTNNYRLIKAIIGLANHFDSSNIIQVYRTIYNENINKLGNNRVLAPDPFHFLFYLLQFLHMEANNSPKNSDPNILNSLTVEQKKNEDDVVTIFINYITSNHKDSIIFDYFFHSEENKFLCPNCGTYYDCELISIFKMPVAKILEWRNRNFKEKINFNLTLDDCFNYYCQNNQRICQCNTSINIYKKIFNWKYIIISFIRDSLGNNREIDFPINFDFSKFSAVTNGKNKYVLNSCISYMFYSGNKGIYISDVNFGLDSENGIWVRYMDKSKQPQNSFQNIYQYQPQMLIYRLIFDNFTQNQGQGENQSNMNNPSSSNYNVIQFSNAINNQNYNNNNNNMNNQYNMNANNQNQNIYQQNMNMNGNHFNNDNLYRVN